MVFVIFKNINLYYPYMELKDRFNILKQGVEIAQSKGALTLDDAVYVKKALESINSNTNLDIAIKILSKTVQLAQSKGCYTLKDAYILYVALDGIEHSIPKPKSEEPSVSTDRITSDKSEI